MSESIRKVIATSCSREITESGLKFVSFINTPLSTSAIIYSFAQWFSEISSKQDAERVLGTLNILVKMVAISALVSSLSGLKLPSSNPTTTSLAVISFMYKSYLYFSPKSLKGVVYFSTFSTVKSLFSGR